MVRGWDTACGWRRMTEMVVAGMLAPHMLRRVVPLVGADCPLPRPGRLLMVPPPLRSYPDVRCIPASHSSPQRQCPEMA